jgi:hypothetical protein
MSQCSTWKLSFGLAVAAVALTFTSTTVAFAQSDASVVVTVPAANAQPLITAKVDESKLVALPSPAIPEGARDLGPASGEMKLGLQLELRRSKAQEDALKLLNQQSLNPSSPLYAKTLTPKEFAETFGLAASDLEVLKNSLTDAGFTVGNVDNGRLTIDFEGTVAQVNAAFHTEIHDFADSDGERHFAPAITLQIPKALSPAISRIAGLQNFTIEERQGFNGPVVDFAGAAEKVHARASSKAPSPILTGEALHDASFTASKYVLGLKGSTTLNVRIGGNTHPVTGSIAIEDQNDKVVGFVEDITKCESYGSYGRSCTADYKPPVGSVFLKAIYSGDENERGVVIPATIISFVGSGTSSLVGSNSPITIFQTPAAAQSSTLTVVLSYYNVLTNPAPTGTITVVYYNSTDTWATASLPTTAGGMSSGNGTSHFNHAYSYSCSGNALEQTFTCTMTMASAWADADGYEGAGGYSLVPTYGGDSNYATSTTSAIGTPGIYLGANTSSYTPTLSVSTPTTNSQTYGSSVSPSPGTITLACTGCNGGRLDGGHTNTGFQAELFVYASAATGTVASAAQLGTGADYTLAGDCTSSTSCSLGGGFPWTSPADLAPGTYTIAYYYTGNVGVTGDTVGPAIGTYSSFTVNKYLPTLSAITSTPATVATGSSTAVTLTDTFTVPDVGVLPSGAVTFTLNSVPYTATCAYTATAGSLTCSATVPAATVAALSTGSYTITSSFAGDGYYSTVTTGGTGTLNVKNPTTAVMVSPTTASPVTQTYGALSAFTVTGQLSWTTAGTPTVSDISFTATGGAISGTSCPATASPITCTATFTPTAADAVGNYKINLSFSGDSNFASAASTETANYVVSQATPTVSLSNITVAYGVTTGQTITVTATGDTGAVATFGTAGGVGGTFSPATCTITSGSCTSSYHPSGTLAVGIYPNDLTVAVAATTNYTAGSATSTLTITQATPTVSLSAVSVQYGIVTGQSITVTATGDAGAVATFGTAGGVGGSFSPATCTITTNTCSSSYIPSGTLVPGTYTADLTVAVAATTNYAAGNATSTLTISKHTTTTTLTVAPTTVSAVSPQAVFTSTTSYATSAGVQATGTISISATGGTWVTIAGIAFPAVGLTTSSGSGATDGGYTYTCTTDTTAETVTCVVTVPAAYSHLVNGATRTITSTYSGDTNYGTSNGTAGLTVAGASTTTMTLSSPAAVIYGEGAAVSFTATLNGAYTSVTFAKPTPVIPTGTITLTNPTLGTLNTITLNTTGSTPCTVTSNVGGGIFAWTVTTQQVCSITYTVPATTAVGSYTITGTYSGDTMYEAATATGTLTVTKQTPTVAVTSVSPASAPYGSGAPSTVTATLSWLGAGNAPTGTPNFASTAGGAFSGESCSGSSSPITCTATFTPAVTDAVGTYTISASYGGDSNYATAASTQTNNYSITQAVLTGITLSADTPGSTSGGVTSVNLTATITPAIAGVTVTFNDTTTGMSFSGATNSSGQVTITADTSDVPFVAAGLNAVTASVTGTANYSSAGPSNTVNIYLQGLLVTTLAHDFSVCYTNPTPPGTPVVGCGQAVSPTDTVGTLNGSPLCNGSNGVLGYTCTAGDAVVVTNWTSAAVPFTLNFTKMASGALSRITNCPTAPATLAAGANCTVIFYYNPPYGDGSSSTVGTYEAGGWSITGGGLTGVGIVSGGVLGNRSGSTGFPTPAVLAGFAVLQPGALGVSAQFSTFPAVAPGVTSNTLTITVTNANPAPVNFTVTGPVAPFSMTSTCASSLAANAVCQIYVTLESSTPGNYSSSVVVTPSGGSAIPVNFSGSVVANALVLNTNSHNFGNVTLNTTQTFNLSVTNSSGAAANASVVDAGASGYTVTTNCPVSPATLPNGAVCGVTVTLDPTGSAGAYNDTVTIGSTTTPIVPGGLGSGPYSSAVSFTANAIGSGSGYFTASTVGHNWGTVNEGTNGGNYGVQLSNGTASAVTLSYTNPLPTEGFTLVGSSCGSSLAVNATCELIFNFSPTSSTGFVTTTYGITGSVPLYAVGDTSDTYSGITLKGTSE